MGILSAFYDGSFGGTGFMELFDGLAAVEPDTAPEVSITHIPGGDSNVVQTSGLSAQMLDLPIGVDATQLAALRTKAASVTRATLVYHAGSVSARLIKVKQVRFVRTSGSYAAVLELLIG